MLFDRYVFVKSFSCFRYQTIVFKFFSTKIRTHFDKQGQFNHVNKVMHLLLSNFKIKKYTFIELHPAQTLIKLLHIVKVNIIVAIWLPLP